MGRYHLAEPLGGGPTGEVFRAKVYGVAGFEREFAIKVFHPGFVSDPDIAAKLAGAARSYGSLEHPRIARLHEYGVAGGETFTATELAQGVDAARLVSMLPTIDQPLPPGAAVALVSQAARAVGYAHGRGIFHLGLCPTNLIATPDGDVKITDFCFLPIRLPDRPGDDPTLRARLPYLAPEQLVGEPTGAATDVYQLGAIAYEVLTGRPPFTGATSPQIAQQILASRPRVPTLPGPVFEVVQRCLRRSPFERFPDARALADALDAAIRTAQLGGDHRDLAVVVRALLARIEEVREGQSSGAVSFPMPAPPMSSGSVAGAAASAASSASSDHLPADASDSTLDAMRTGLFAPQPARAMGRSETMPTLEDDPSALQELRYLEDMPTTLRDRDEERAGKAKVGSTTAPGVGGLSPRAPTPRPPSGGGPPARPSAPAGPATGRSPVPARRSAPGPVTAPPAFADDGDTAIDTAVSLSQPLGQVVGPAAGRTHEPPHEEVGGMRTVIGIPGMAPPAQPPGRPSPAAGGPRLPSAVPPRPPTAVPPRPPTAVPPRRSGAAPVPAAPLPGAPVPAATIPGVPAPEATIPGAPDAGETIPGTPARAAQAPAAQVVYPTYEPLPGRASDALATPPQPLDRVSVGPLVENMPLPSPPRSEIMPAALGIPDIESLVEETRRAAEGEEVIYTEMYTRPRSRGIWVLAALIVVALLGGGFLVYQRFLSGGPKSTARAPEAVAAAVDAGAGRPAPGAGAAAAGTAVAGATDAGEAAAPTAKPATPGRPAQAAAVGGTLDMQDAPADKLLIRSKPEGAKVYLDGSLQGKTPLTLDATADKHGLAVIQPGHRLFTAEIQGHGTVDIALEEVAPPGGEGGIKIRCRNKNRYYVFLDGNDSGQLCPTERIGADVGEHVIEIYDPETESRQEFRVNVEQTRRSTRLRVD